MHWIGPWEGIKEILEEFLPLFGKNFKTNSGKHKTHYQMEIPLFSLEKCLALPQKVINRPKNSPLPFV